MGGVVALSDRVDSDERLLALTVGTVCGGVDSVSQSNLSPPHGAHRVLYFLSGGGVHAPTDVHVSAERPRFGGTDILDEARVRTRCAHSDSPRGAHKYLRVRE